MIAAVESVIALAAVGLLWSVGLRGFSALLGCLLAAGIAWQFFGDGMADRGAMLRQRLCPSCGGMLDDGLSADRSWADCPECGAGWRLPRADVCARCGYDLAGARAVDGDVVCPECGDRFAADG